MNNLPQIFNNPKFGEIRTIEIEGKIYFVASDIAKALGYMNPSKAINDHCKGVTKRYIPTNGGNQEMNVIPEGDIYRLAAKSELPGAEEFESWIFDEVLPQIRKTGSYQIKSMTPAEMFLQQAQLNVEQEKKLLALETKQAAQDETIQSIKEALLPNDKEWRKSINEKINQVAKACDSDYREVRSSSYKTLEQRGACNLSRRVQNLKNRLSESGATKTTIGNACKLDAIESDKRLKEIYSSIVREMVVKYVA